MSQGHENLCVDSSRPNLMEDDLKKNKKWKTTSKINKNGRRPQAQLKKINLIGCDITVN